MTVAGWPKPENARSNGTTPGNHGDRERAESDEIVAPAPQISRTNTSRSRTNKIVWSIVIAGELRSHDRRIIDAMKNFLSKERIVAGPAFNRWLVPPASIAIHLCIGSVYAWSIYNPALVRVFGVVTPAAEDWSLARRALDLQRRDLFLGLAAAFAGTLARRRRPAHGRRRRRRLLGRRLSRRRRGYRRCTSSGSCTGYGVIGGCGLGLGYVSPVSTLIRWFPDRRGMATGMAIMGFGGGAIIGAPLKECLIRFFYRAPDYLGTTAQRDARHRSRPAFRRSRRADCARSSSSAPTRSPT